MKDESLKIYEKKIDRLDQEKLYIQLTRIFLDEINSGKWGAGDKIPSEDDLCSMYNVSRITVRQAMNNLVSDGYLIKKQGLGTFVANVLPVTGIAMKTRLTDNLFGGEVKLRREILERGIRQSREDVKRYLGAHEEVYYIHSKAIVDGEPVNIDESFIPLSLMPALDNKEIRNISFYNLIQEKVTKKVAKVIQTIEMSEIDKYASEILRIDKQSHCILMHRLFIGAGGTPIAYTWAAASGKKYKLYMEFERVK